MQISATPISFDGCQGYFNSVSGSAGVLMCAPWGFDELCSRKFFRCLSDAFAGAGLPALRFDYPNTVDALDVDGDCDLDCWIRSADTAAEQLRMRSGCTTIIVLGMGVGAIVAHALASKREDVAGLILAAPVVSGRQYLRELSIRARVINEGLSLRPEQLAEGVTIGGNKMPAQLAADFKQINLLKAEPVSDLKTLIVARENVAGDEGLAAHLSGQGSSVTRVPFHGFEKLMENPTLSVVPQDVVAAVATWCRQNYPLETAGDRDTRSAGETEPLSTEEFVETAMIVRPEQPLHGVLCEPAGKSEGPVLLLLNSGYDHHGGWSRIWVRTARTLARAGVSSFRFDFSNVGDSPAKNGVAAEVLYTDGPIEDTKAVVDAIKARTNQPVFLVGRCSGAYTAFQSAFADEKVEGAILINQVRFIWDSDEDLHALYETGPRPLGEYKKRAANINTLKRLFTGDIDVFGVLRSLSAHAVAKVRHYLEAVLPIPTKSKAFRKECHGMFDSLNARGVPLHLICSVGDESLEQLEMYFGAGLRGLEKYPKVSLETIPDADHNITPDAAQDRLVELITKAASSYQA